MRGAVKIKKKSNNILNQEKINKTEQTERDGFGGRESRKYQKISTEVLSGRIGGTLFNMPEITRTIPKTTNATLFSKIQYEINRKEKRKLKGKKIPESIIVLRLVDDSK